MALAISPRDRCRHILRLADRRSVCLFLLSSWPQIDDQPGSRTTARREPHHNRQITQPYPMHTTTRYAHLARDSIQNAASRITGSIGEFHRRQGVKRGIHEAMNHRQGTTLRWAAVSRQDSHRPSRRYGFFADPRSLVPLGIALIPTVYSFNNCRY